MTVHTVGVRSLQQFAVLAAGALILAGIAPATSAATAAAPSKAPLWRIRPLASANGSLLYLKDRSRHRVGQFVHSASATLNVLEKSGAHRRLATLPRNAGVSVAGSMVGFVDDDRSVSCSQPSRWWNLATGRHGTEKFTCGQQPFTVTPHGWLYGQRDGFAEHVWLQSLKGNDTDLGDPLPETEFYSLLTDAHGAVAFSDGDDDDDTEAAGFAYMSWANPGVWRTLQNLGDPDDRCTGLSRRYLACDAGGQLGLIPLNGQRPATSGRCEADSVTVFHGLALWLGGEGGRCANGHLAELTPNGNVTVSHRRYKLPGSPVPFRGRIMITNASQSKILSLSGINAKPKVVLSAP
jgi:hypothetical protein